MLLLGHLEAMSFEKHILAVSDVKFFHSCLCLLNVKRKTITMVVLDLERKQISQEDGIHTATGHPLKLSLKSCQKDEQDVAPQKASLCNNRFLLEYFENRHYNVRENSSLFSPALHIKCGKINKTKNRLGDNFHYHPFHHTFALHCFVQ